MLPVVVSRQTVKRRMSFVPPTTVKHQEGPINCKVFISELFWEGDSLSDLPSWSQAVNVNKG